MLNDKKVNKSKVPVPNQGIVSIGSCRFRFDYHTDILTSIEEEESGEQVSFVASIHYVLLSVLYSSTGTYYRINFWCR